MLTQLRQRWASTISYSLNSQAGGPAAGKYSGASADKRRHEGLWYFLKRIFTRRVVRFVDVLREGDTFVYCIGTELVSVLHLLAYAVIPLPLRDTDASRPTECYVGHLHVDLAWEARVVGAGVLIELPRNAMLEMFL
ncbi:hypothetical protein PT974_12404 [Cladobotryum mycophilum]|uniref:Uncharacterized protein n=1 Tax=Cladobotryum mycophilum TaxID=491253 RepID=A0ABR0S8V3_9HYPO